MGQLIVRDIDDDIARALRERAVANGRSAEAEHRMILREVLQPAPDMTDFAAAAARLRARLHAGTDSVELIRAGRAERGGRMNPPGDCVVDASVALKWVLDEEGSDAAAALLDGRRLYAPPLLLIEAGNALWVACRRGAISPSDAEDALHQIAAAPFRNWSRQGNLPADAFRLARLLDHPVYDCTYLALAMSVGIPVVTADRRFVQAAGRVSEARALVCLLGVSGSENR